MVALVLSGLIGQAGPQPRIVEAGLASPSVLCLDIKQGSVVVRPVEPNPDYRPGCLVPEDRGVMRDGKLYGVIVGVEGKEIQPFDIAPGAKWNPTSGDEPAEVKLWANGARVKVKSVFRKTFPMRLAQTEGWAFDGEQLHRLYLTAPSSLSGASIRVAIPGAGEHRVRLSSSRVRTEGLRVNQVGFRPDDPEKSALWTVWMGTGGGLTWAPSAFEVLDEKTRKVAFRGKPRLHHPGGTADDAYGNKGAESPVYLLDFSAFKKPGRYVLHIPGVGVSWPFSIHKDAWTSAFRTATKGFYFQRNGISHGPPYSQYRAPRAFHPADGVKVYHSTTSLMDSGNGLNALGTDKDNFGNLVKGATDQVVPNAWGGYKDAGDWDGRIQHLDATRDLLEVALLFPEKIKGVGLNIPESGQGLPDVLAEARWNLDHYKRMQTPEGGIRGGVEQEEHPKTGETSWRNSWKNLAYSPDPWTSWLYAATAARFSHAVKPISPSMAGEYLASAIKAYDWGVKELERLNRPSYPHAVKDARHLAAVELCRATGEKRFGEDALALTGFLPEGSPVREWEKLDQGEAAFTMAREKIPSPQAAARARAAILASADQVLEVVKGTAWRHAWMDRNAWPGYSRDVNPLGAKPLIWAHVLTGDAKYLKGLIQGDGYKTGINGTNHVMVSGVGANPVLYPFMVDARLNRQPFPPGITVYGPLSAKNEPDGPWWKLATPFVYPAPAQWPLSETFYDSFWVIMMSEFTIMQSMGPTSLVWGYLAFRP